MNVSFFSPPCSLNTLLQSVANLPPSGESLKILAQDLGNRVYTKYAVRQKHQNKMLEKLSNIYNTYTELLAKDTQVNKSLCRRSNVSQFAPNTLRCSHLCAGHLHARMYSSSL